MPTQGTREASNSWPSTDELLACFTDDLPEQVMAELRDLKLSPSMTAAEIKAELVALGIDSEALFREKGLS